MWLHQVSQFSSFIGQCACLRCGKALRYDECKSLQIGVAAQWTAVCTNDKCHALPMLLRTSEMHAAPHEDEPKLNTKAHFAAVTCAVNPTRLNDVLGTLGLGRLSNRGHYKVKEELEPVAAHCAQASMATAYETELGRPRGTLPRTLCIDGSWDHGRLGNTCIMPFMAANGPIVHLENARRTEKGVKSSNALEMLAFKKGVMNPRVADPFFESITMDGCKQLIAAAQEAGKSSEGDGWHHTKARAKGFRGHTEAFVHRPKPTAVETEAKRADKVAKPKVRRLSLPPSLPSLSPALSPTLLLSHL